MATITATAIAVFTNSPMVIRSMRQTSSDYEEIQPLKLNQPLLSQLISCQAFQVALQQNEPYVSETSV